MTCLWKNRTLVAWRVCKYAVLTYVTALLCARKPIKSRYVCASNFPDLGTKFKKAGLFMKDYHVQYLLIKDLSQYKRQLLGPLLFKIFINDIFLLAKNSTLYNHTNDSNQFSCEKSFDQVINNLQTDFLTLIKVWFCDNFLV